MCKYIKCIATGVGTGLRKLIGLFYKYEFSHADNN